MQATQQTDQVNNLEEIQSGIERTRTIDVIERVIATGEDGNPIEIEKPTKVFVRPLPMRRWSLAIGYLQELIRALPSFAGMDLSNPQVIGLVAGELISAADAQVFGLLMLATDKDIEFFDRIDLDEGIKIIIAVVEVNKDFFVQKVLPMVTAKAPAIQTALQETFGQTQ